jgi:toxin ParE1/3/4
VTYQVEFLDSAADDMVALHLWVETETDPTTADAYLDRLRTRCIKLAEFPHRGTPRDDLSPGARSLSFERRILIFYRVKDEMVQIMHVVSTAREIASLT